MSEIGDDYTALRSAGKEKKLKNKEYSTNLLLKEGIKFESKNNGIHLIVQGERRLIDFWPSTGKFIVREKNYHGRGVKNLISLIKTGYLADDKKGHKFHD